MEHSNKMEKQQLVMNRARDTQEKENGTSVYMAGA
jgi:hypothetical protein